MTIRSVETVVLALICVLTPSTESICQTTHPDKEKFVNSATWPAISPGDVELKNFSPFRAVYERTYTNPAGQPRRDRVIIAAEEVGWDGTDAIAVTLIDSADPLLEDTNARTLFMYVDRSDLSVLFEVGPQPGTAKDFYITRSFSDSLVLNTVTTDGDSRDTRSFDTGVAGFGPGTWVMANADLDVNRQLRLDPYYSPRANALTGFTTFAIVAGSERFGMPDGSSIVVHVIEHASNLQNSAAIQRLVRDSPPYLFGSRRIDLDTGEMTESMRLIQFDLFKR